MSGCVWLWLHILSTSEFLPKSTKRITDTVEHDYVYGIHTEISPGVTEQRENV